MKVESPAEKEMDYYALEKAIEGSYKEFVKMRALKTVSVHLFSQCYAVAVFELPVDENQKYYFYLSSAVY